MSEKTVWGMFTAIQSLTNATRLNVRFMNAQMEKTVKLFTKDAREKTGHDSVEPI